MQLRVWFIRPRSGQIRGHARGIDHLRLRPKKAGTACKVRFALAGSKTKKVDLNFRIVTSRPSSGAQGHICVGFVMMSEEFLEELEDLLRSYTERPDLGMAARRSQRLPISLKTMGRELPGFSCVTVDISEHGVRLNCHGPLKQGQVVNLVLESDVASVDNFGVRGRVVWCRENKEVKGHLVGVEFVEVTPAQADALERYHKSLAGRLRGTSCTAKSPTANWWCARTAPKR